MVNVNLFYREKVFFKGLELVSSIRIFIFWFFYWGEIKIIVLFFGFIIRKINLIKFFGEGFYFVYD